MARIIIQLGLRTSIAVRVLQLEVGVVLLLLPFQTKFSRQLLFPSLPPPLATFPDSKADEHKEEDKASKEYVGPPAQNLGLEFLLLLALWNGGFLALVGGKQGVCGISGNIDAAHPSVDEGGVSLTRIGYRHKINEGIIVERAALDTAKNCQTV